MHAPGKPELADARRAGLLNIGQAAAASGVSAKMIRHYEDGGVIPKARRTAAGYRLYREEEVHALRFIRRARDLGFPLAEVKALLGLWGNRRRASADVKSLALKHATALEARIRQMQEMKETLLDLAKHCHGDQRPECPILEDLAGHAATTAERLQP